MMNQSYLRGSTMALSKTLGVLLLLLTPILPGQTVVEGTVHVSGGAVLPGVTIELNRENGSQVAVQISTADGHFRFNAIEAGAYRVQATAPKFYSAASKFVLRPRQPVAVDLELQRKELVSEQVEVREHYLTVDPQKTGS